LGILAIIFWSSNVAFSRSLTEQLGSLTAAAYIYLLGGILSILYAIASKKIKNILQLPTRYLLSCGTLFITYTLCLFLAIGLVSTRQQVVEVALINYLWPALTLLFSVPILKKKARISLLPGIIIGFLGIFLITAPNLFSQTTFLEKLVTNFVPYMLAFAASILWGLYSTLSRKWAGNSENGAVPLFLLSTGLIFTFVTFFSFEEVHWTPNLLFELLFTAIFPTFLSYTFWDVAIRKGKIILVAALSYFIPVLSTILSSLILGIFIGVNVWVACSLVIAGAVICNFSIKD